jgi:TetR/AcrR family transcriptional regulator, tetracycline repressor protein
MEGSTRDLEPEQPEDETSTAGALNPRQEQIVAAALESLKADGLNGLSLRGIAKRLNVQAPALYWHFKNKEALIDYMAESILQGEFKDLEARQADRPWQDWLEEHLIRLRRAMLAYPDGGRVVAGAHFYPAVTLPAFMDRALESLTSDGVSLQVASHVVMTAVYYTFGFVIEEQAGTNRDDLADFDEETFFGSFPHLGQLLVAAEGRGAPDSDFTIGLRYIIEGSQAPSR